MTNKAWTILRDINRKKRGKVSINILQDKKEGCWRCTICNKSYTLQNQYYHFNSEKHKKNLNIARENIS